MNPRSRSVAIRLLACAGWLCIAASPAWGQNGTATTPPGGFPIGAIQPILQMPRPTDPEFPTAGSCPYPRVSGLYAFTDDRNPVDPNDDREYMVACRSDGIFVIDGTADRTETFATILPTLPANPDYLWIPENVIPLPGVPEESYLNGVPAGPMYCPSPVQFNSGHATNREAVVYHDRVTDHFFVYSISNLRQGVWVIELERDPASATGMLRLVSQHWKPTFPQVGHTIAIDAERGFLFVATLSTMNVLSISLSSGGPRTPQFLFAYYTRPGFNEIGSGPHDMMVRDDFLFVSCWTAGVVDVFDMQQLDRNNAANWRRVRRVQPPQINNDPLQPSYIGAVHSVWVDNDQTPPTMYLLEENSRTNIDAADISGINYKNNPPTPDLYRPSSQHQVASLQGLIPNPTSAPVAMVHHLRAEGRTGFLAHYTDGIDLVDLTNPSSMDVLASFDTTALTQTAPAPWFLIDNFLGVWDVAPNQDSGLVFASGGREGAFVFRFNEGQLNRYWNVSPFPQNRRQPRTVYPRIVAPFGPPRAGRPFYIRDANYGRYKNPAQLRWSCYLSVSPPTGVIQDRQRGIKLNLDPNASLLLQNAPGNDIFGFPAMPMLQGQKFFVQLVVEARDAASNLDASIYAASRGAWFGLAAP